MALIPEANFSLDALHRRFSQSHEWIEYDTETKIGKLGITKFAADALGDIVHVDLPAEGDTFDSGESIVSTAFKFNC